MRPSRGRLKEMLEEAAELPAGKAQVNAYREAAEHAEAAGLVDLQVEARLGLVEAMIEADAYDIAGVNDTLTAFSRVVALYVSAPQEFDEEQQDGLWRQFAMMGITMAGLPDYPLATIRRLLDDMEGRCRPLRDDRYVIHALRVLLAEMCGDTAMGDRSLEELQRLDAPDYSCPACLHMWQVRYLERLGRDEQAIAAAEPVLSGLLPCLTDEQPHRTLAILTLPYLRTGRVEEARDAYRMSLRRPLMDHVLAWQLRFCVLTGNLDQALDLIKGNLTMLEDTPVTSNDMDAAAAAALVCRIMVEAGRGEEILAWPANPDIEGDEDEEWTYRELLEEFRKDALGFAERLDRRNGNTYISDQIRAVIDAEPILDHLPLSALGARQAELARNASPRPGTDGPGDQTVPTPSHSPQAGTPDEAPQHERARALEHAKRGYLLAGEGRYQEAIEESIEAVARFTALGELRLATLARVDLATAYLSAGRPLDAAEVAEEALPDIPDDLQREYTGLQCRWVLARAYPALDQHEDALRILAEMRTLGDTGDPEEMAQLYWQEGVILSDLDRDAEASEAFEAAARHHATAGDTVAEVAGLRRATLAAGWSGQPERVVALADRAHMAVERLPADDPDTSGYRALVDFDVARALGAVERRAEAAESAERAAELFRTLDEPVMATRADGMAGEFLWQAGHSQRAAEPLRRAIAGPAVDEEHRQEQVYAARLLVGLLHDLDHHQEAEQVAAAFPDEV